MNIVTVVPVILSWECPSSAGVRKWCLRPLVDHRPLPHWRRPPCGTGSPRSAWWCAAPWPCDWSPYPMGCLWSGHLQVRYCPIGRRWLWSAAHEEPLWERWTTLSHSHELSWPLGSLVGLWRLQGKQLHVYTYTWLGHTPIYTIAQF